ncbi:MAG: NAD(P)/FAD-dependent oxidoreductase [Chloroflexota bacterium]|nr:NAD(P)/FAD-dependent oxidoreductase [Chloroflexota bacterium]MDE2920845.1 NAD(P)/FAD-dependent oxidoreductase [Chloroflexota bacterium]
MDYDAIIIGCGHNGLVAAFYLARAGLRVLALEQGPKIGGAATTDELFPGFHFSTCAHSFVLFHPQILDDMQLVERGLRVFQRDPVQFHLFADDQYLLSWNDPERTRESIARLSRHDADAYARYGDFWQRAAQLFDPYLLDAPPTLDEFLRAAEDTPDARVAHTLVTGTRRQLLDEYFESPRVKASLGTTFDAGSTDNAGGLLYFAYAAALSRRLSKRGLAGFPQGGMGTVTRLLGQAAEDAGTKIRVATPVASVHAVECSVRGVTLVEGTVITARIVLSNADPQRTFVRLVAAEHVPDSFLRSVRGLRLNAGYLKLHCATTGLPDWRAAPGDGPQHGANVRICESLDDIDRAWSEARAGRTPMSPVLGLVCPSVYDSSVAPAGRHTISIWAEYAPVGLPEGVWEERREETTDALIAQVARYAPNFPDIVSDTFLHGPPEIEARTGMTRGNMHHVDMNIDQMLGARPLPGCAGYRTPLDGLYLCGSGCHPGRGVSGVPGYNAARTVVRDLNRPA